MIKLNQAIKKIGEDLIEFKFNTAISTLMELTNVAKKKQQLTGLTKGDFRCVLKVLYPFAPHTTQELWQKLGQKTLLEKETWPEVDKKYLEPQEKIIIIQINGRKRADLTVPKNYSIKEIEAQALKQERIKQLLKGKKVAKTIFAGDRVLNFVTG